jgi:plasmid stability protein
VAALTIRNLDESLKHQLRRRAADNNRSMEEEARTILRDALAPKGETGRPDMLTEIRRLVDLYGASDDLELLPDEPVRPMSFE